jgi:Siphovirus ReqiPepy6 Gp37-like protein/Galactose oxidase, central domain
MEIYTLDRTFKKLDLIEEFESAIWTERYYGDGEVELVVPTTMSSFKKLSLGTLLSVIGSYEVMILETMEEIDSKKFRFSGITLLEWLNNRFIRTSSNHIDRTWNIESMTPGEILWTMLAAACTHYSPYLTGTIDIGIPSSYLERLIIPEIDLHSFDNTGDPINVGIPFGPLFDPMKDLAMKYEIGMQLLLEAEINPASPFPLGFRSYRGTDRTSDQFDNPVVRFSPDSEALINPREIQTVSTLKTTIFVFSSQADDSITDPGIADRSRGLSGLDMRALEYFADEVLVDVPDEDLVPDLSDIAFKQLNAHRVSGAVDGEVIPSSQIKYGRDYFLGDLVEIKGNSDIISLARVTEYIRTRDASGGREYPTFSVIGQVEVPTLLPLPEPPPPPPPPPPSPDTWVNLGPATHPSARSTAGIAYDPGLDKVLLWHGYNYGHTGGSLIEQTYLYDFSTNNWTNASPTHHPGNAIVPSSEGAPGWGSTAWDGIRVIQIAGANYGISNPGHGRNRIWGYSSGDWTQIYDEDLITMIKRPDIIYDVGPYMLVIGTWEPYPSLVAHNYIYKWNPTTLTFTQIFPSVIVAPTSGQHGQIAVNGTDVYYYGQIQGGGTTCYLYKWNFTSEDWDLITTVHNPPSRGSFVFNYDALSDSFILFGGRSGVTYLNDTWQFKVSTGDWTDLTSILALSPSPRTYASCASTPDGLLLFGGDDGSAYSSQTWTLHSS